MRGDRSRLRVAITARGCYPWHGFGGLERHVYHLVKHLLSHDVHVTLITRSRAAHTATTDADTVDFSAHPYFRLIQIPYVTFPFAGRRGTTVLDRSTAYLLFGWRAGRVAATLARSGQVDIVHSLGASGLGYANARRRRESAVPLVFNPQGLEEFGSTSPGLGGLKAAAYGPLRTAVRFCARHADRVIATDRALESTVQQHLAIGPAQLVTIPNAVDLDECDRGSPPASGESSETASFVFLSVGRLQWNKGFDVVVRALGSGQSPMPNIQWILIGDGPQRSRLERLSNELHLRKVIRFTGAVRDRELHRWYERATVFIHPTRYEGSSLVTLEAMAHRLPVIATRAGGLPDKVFPNLNGWLVEPDDVEGLRRAMDQSLRISQTNLKMMGCRSRTIVERSFAWPVVTERLIELYRELLDMGTSTSHPARTSHLAPRTEHIAPST